MGFQRINITLTDSQYRVLMLESNATGLKVGTVIRMLIHDDIATGRANRAYRMKKAHEALENASKAVQMPEGV